MKMLTLVLFFILVNYSPAVAAENTKINQLIAERDQILKDQKNIVEEIVQYLAVNSLKDKNNLAKECLKNTNGQIKVEKISKKCRDFVKEKIMFNKKSKSFMDSKSQRSKELTLKLEETNLKIIELLKDEK